MCGKDKAMNVSLTPELEQLVQNKVQTGRYNSASEVVREALRLMEERDQVKAEVRKKIAAGVASAQAGRMSDGEEFFAQMEGEIDEEIRAEDEKAARESAAL
jgi:antitoxin ParD1/3/4